MISGVSCYMHISRVKKSAAYAARGPRQEQGRRALPCQINNALKEGAVDPMKLTKNRQLGILCLFLCAFIVWQCGKITIRSADFEIVGPRTFPLIAAGLFGICGIALLFQKQEGEDEKYMTGHQLLRAAVMLGAYLLYLVLLYYVGLRIAAPIAVFVMTMLFGKGKVKWWQAAIFSIVFGICFYLLYVNLLHIRVPKGILRIFR